MASDVISTVVNRLNGGPSSEGYVDLTDGNGFIQLTADGSTPSTVIYGIWESTPIDIAYGGTNATTAPNALTNLGAVPLAGGTMTGLLILSGDPVNPLGAATKEYVDAISQGLTFKNACYAGTIGSNLNATYLNGVAGVGATLTNNGSQAAFSIDSVSPPLNSRILVKDQSTTYQNGIYTLTTVGSGATNWVLTRSTDYDLVTEIQPGDFVLIDFGTINTNTGWVQTATVATIGFSPITFSQFGNSGTVTSVSGTALQIDVANGTTTPVISIDSGYVGQTSITTLGTITTGVWNGSLVPLAYGGTNANLTASNGGIFYSTASAGAILAGTATAGQLLRSGSSAAPTWTTTTYPSTNAINTILYASSANVMSALATANNGVLLTSGTGVPSIGNATVAVGGTGNTTFTAYSVICAGTTATGSFQNVVGVGTSGQVLTSAGASALPAWQTPTAGTVTSVSGTALQIDVANGTTTPVISIDSGYVGQSSITTLGTIGTGTWQGSIIALAYGGTNANLTASNGGIFYSTASAGAILAGTATAGQLLRSGSSAAPTWTTSTYPATNAINTILYASAANVMSALATANNGVLLTSGSGVPSIGNATVSVGGTGNTTFTAYSVICAGTTATGSFQNVVGVGTSGQVLTSAGASALPAWATPTAGTVTSVSGTALQIDVANGTTTPVISIDSGYVGQTSITTLGTITTGVWNGSLIPLAYGGTNANLTASNGGIFYSTATAGAILAGTATAGQLLRSGSSTAPTWTTTTYPSTNAINTLLYASAANVMGALATANNGVLITSSGGVPSIGTTLPTGVQTNITELGTITTGVWNGSLIPLAYGGTNANLTASNGGIFYSTATAGAILAGTATAGQLLLSGATAAPTWSTSTYPSTNAINTILYASAANVMSALATANNGVLLTNGSGVPSIGNATVPVGGTGNTTFTAYSVICAGTTATGSFQNVSGVGSSGQVLTSAGASALPTWSNPTGGVIVNQNTSTVTMTAGDRYYINNGASLVTLTLPSTAAQGDRFQIMGGSSGGWKIGQNASQTINLDNTPTTTGTGGSLASTNQYDCITVDCITANTTFVVSNSVGSITVV